MIVIRNLSKRYRIYKRPLDRLLSLLPETRLTPRNVPEFWALKCVSLEIPRGHTLGIVGPNGAGKSTLLKLIARTTYPTEGTIEVSGRVAALLELGTGFHPEFTGRQNIYINGKMLGLSEEDIRQRENEIVEFAELGRFVDQPLRTYSSGMVVRLGFSVAACVNPDVLIVDEALSVGDAYFSQKCITRIRKFREEGTTILFVSHDPSAIAGLCDRAILLDEGSVQQEGDPQDVLEEYNAVIARKSERNKGIRQLKSSSNVENGHAATESGSGSVGVQGGNSFEYGGESAVGGSELVSGGGSRMGSFLAFVESAELLNEKDHAVESLITGRRAAIMTRIIFLASIPAPTVGIMIRNRLGQVAFATNSEFMGVKLGHPQMGDQLSLRWEFENNLGPGEYTLTVAVHTSTTHLEDCFDWIDRCLAFRVVEAADMKFYGSTRLYPGVTVQRTGKKSDELQSLLQELFSDSPSEITDMQDAASDRYLLRGWHAAEESGEAAFRWTDAQAIFAINPCGDRLLLDCAAWGREDGEPVGLVFEILGGEWKECTNCRPGERDVLSIPLPRGLAKGTHMIQMTCDPFESEGRTLGLAVFSIATGDRA